MEGSFPPWRWLLAGLVGWLKRGPGSLTWEENRRGLEPRRSRWRRSWNGSCRFIEEAAGALSVPVSVDTRNAAVARAALRAGARIVNDVSGLRHDPEMAGVVAEEGAALVVSHMRGTPATMKERARYHDVVGEVVAELREGVEAALEAGVAPERIVVDPGIGFAKTGPQSLALLRGLDHLLALGRPVLVGPSRKSFIGEITGQPVGERSAGTLAACVLAYARGARIFRVHEVGPAIQALAVTRAILEAY